MTVASKITNVPSENRLSVKPYSRNHLMKQEHSTPESERTAWFWIFSKEKSDEIGLEIRICCIRTGIINR